MGYIIKLDQGDWLECRGGYDWGRTNAERATRFDTREEAERFASRVPASQGVFAEWDLPE